MTYETLPELIQDLENVLESQEAHASWNLAIYCGSDGSDFRFNTNLYNYNKSNDAYTYIYSDYGTLEAELDYLKKYFSAMDRTRFQYSIESKEKGFGLIVYVTNPPSYVVESLKKSASPIYDLSSYECLSIGVVSVVIFAGFVRNLLEHR